MDVVAEDMLSNKDVEDLLCLCDLQSKHMSRNIRESHNAMHEEENLLRCGDVGHVRLERTVLNSNGFDSADYADAKRLDKYADEYNLSLMGADNGLWFYFDEKAVCGEPCKEYLFTTVSSGQYAAVTVANPFTFSVIRIWDYICLWMRKNSVTMKSC